ncbi:MAG: nuclear transport factor 2 family protein [Saprospiraceae bacterium]|nr:nuclear transport factor 2 family protein [Saprospiraceae bacterium]
MKIEAVERQRFTAMTTKDTSLLRNLLADDLTYLHSNGILENKAQHLANIGTGKMVYKTMEPSEMKVRINGRTAIVNGQVHVTGFLGEKPFDIQLRYTDVYFKQKGKWRLAAWQSLKLEDKK